MHEHSNIKELCFLRCWLRCKHFFSAWALPIPSTLAHTQLSLYYMLYDWHCVLWSHDLSVPSWHSVCPCSLIQEAEATQRKQGRPVQEEDSQTGDWPEGAPGGRAFGSKIWWLWWWTQREDRGKHQRNVSVSDKEIIFYYMCLQLSPLLSPSFPLSPLSPSYLSFFQEWTKGKTVSHKHFSYNI